MEKYVKKELEQRLEKIKTKQKTASTPSVAINKTQYVFEKFNTKYPSIKVNPKVEKSDEKNVIQNDQKENIATTTDMTVNPEHYIEEITKQKQSNSASHTVIKKTHITIDEIRDTNRNSDSIEKHIEVDESETDIETQNQSGKNSVDDIHVNLDKKDSAKVLENQWRGTQGHGHDLWPPVAGSHAARNSATDMNHSFQPHGGIIGAAVSCVVVSIGILVVLLILWKRYFQKPGDTFYYEWSIDVKITLAFKN